MDTTKLRVGQDVSVDAGVYGLSGKVVKIRWWGVYVRTYMHFGDQASSRLIRFDKEGELVGDDPRCLLLPREGGPWYPHPLPESEQVRWEQTTRKHQPFVVWWKSATYEQRLALVTKYYTTRLAPPLRANFAPAEAVAKIADISLDPLLMTELNKERITN